jgi:hypothetical protein
LDGRRACFCEALALALIGIKPLDLVAFASTSALMALVAALATWVPAAGHWRGSDGYVET